MDSSAHLIYHDSSDLRSPILIRIIPNKRTLYLLGLYNSAGRICNNIFNLRYKVNFDFIIYCFQQAMFIFYTNRTFWEINLIYISTPVHKIWMLIFKNIFKTQRNFIFTCSRSKNLIWIWHLHKLQVNDWNYISFFYIKISKFLMAISQSNHQKIEMTLLDRNAMI